MRSESPSRRPLRILVVDDNVDTARALELMLMPGDHVVKLAHNGNDALQLAQLFEPDVIFVDILLPGMNGYDVALNLRRMPELKRPLLAAVTGWAGEDRRNRSRAAGFDEHLTKPVDFACIDRILARAVEGRL